MKYTLKLLLSTYLLKARKKRERLSYIRPIFENRSHRGEAFLVRELAEDPFYHHKYFRMNKQSFDDLHDAVKDAIKHESSHRVPISTLERLAVTLRFLASGNSQLSVALSYRISPSSVSIILREVMEALCTALEKTYLPVPTKDDWLQKEAEFSALWNFPTCIGGIDGKHVRIKCPQNSASSYYNYKGYFSIVLLAIVDANYKFTIVDIGSEGSASDGGILKDSILGKRLDTNNLSIPISKNLPLIGEMGYVFLGDSGFPLKHNLMRPFPGKYLPTEEKVFNYRLSRARRVSENGFGLLAARFRIYHTCLEGSVEFIKLVVKTTVLLHNYLLSKKDTLDLTVDTDSNCELVKGNWRQEISRSNALQEINRQGSNNYNMDAFEVREKLKLFFNSAQGSVPWQEERVNST